MLKPRTTRGSDIFGFVLLLSRKYPAKATMLKAHTDVYSQSICACCKIFTEKIVQSFGLITTIVNDADCNKYRRKGNKDFVYVQTGELYSAPRRTFQNIMLRFLVLCT